MALRTVSILGGNWNAVTTWVEGIVPINSDDVKSTATSGNLVLSTLSDCRTIDLTNYTGTLSGSGLLRIYAGVVNFGGTITATSTIQFQNNPAIITSNGVAWNGNIDLFSGVGTATINGLLSIKNLSLNGYGITGSNIVVNGDVASGYNQVLGGTTEVLISGTGTLSGTGNIRTRVIIKSTAILTISGIINYFASALTNEIGSIVNTAGSTLNVSASTTLDTNVINWNNVSFTSGITTLTSDLNCKNLTSLSTTINGLFNVNVSGNLRNIGIGTTSGTATLVLNGTGTFSTDSNAGGIQNNLIINTSGTITFGNVISYNTGTLTYVTGKIITKNSTFYLTLPSTLINCHKINFNDIIINSGQTITMNEFFSGSPSLVTNISSDSLTSNYTIAFRDGFEKISKFVNINNCTLSKPLQLLVTTNSPRSSTNKGIRYINQSPNGIAKGKPSINALMTFGAGGLLSDPNMK